MIIGQEGIPKQHTTPVLMADSIPGRGRMKLDGREFVLVFSLHPPDRRAPHSFTKLLAHAAALVGVGP